MRHVLRCRPLAAAMSLLLGGCSWDPLSAYDVQDTDADVPEAVEDDGKLSEVGESDVGDELDGSNLDCRHLDGVCRVGAVDPETGACIATARPDDEVCDDGLACTTDDRCAGGACVGDARVCSDDRTCTTDRCDEVAGGCVFDTAGCACAADADCQDDDLCNGSEVCDLELGQCKAGAPVSCTHVENACHTGQCDSANGHCVKKVVQDGTPCSDGAVCTKDDACQEGACVGIATTCDDGKSCTLDSCNERAGGCVFESSGCACSVDLDCDDANPCNGQETCDVESGVCQPGLAIDCSSLDSQCATGVCSRSTGSCEVAVQPNGLSCDDADACTQTDTCQEGQCVGQNLKTCGAPGPCHQPATCHSGTGTCEFVPKLDGSSCDDGNACSTSDTCQAGECLGGDAPDDKVGDWARSLVTSSYTSLHALVHDPLSDGVVLVGSFTGPTITLGQSSTGSMKSLNNPAELSVATFAADFSASGDVDSAFILGHSKDALGIAAALRRPDGGLLVAGAASGGGSWFGVGPGSQLVETEVHAAYVQAVDASGNLQWLSHAEGLVAGYHGIGLGSEGAVMGVGSFGGTPLNFLSPGALTSLTPSGFVFDGFVVRLEQDGNLEWAAKLGGSDDDVAHAIAGHTDGSASIVGQFCGSAQFGNGAAAVTLTADASCDGFVARYAASGQLLWVRRVGGATSNDVLWDVRTNAVGHVVAVGQVSGPAAVATNNANLGVLAGEMGDGLDAAIVAFDADGTFLWGHRNVGAGDDSAYRLSLDGSGRWVMAGTFAHVAVFGSGEVSDVLTTKGGANTSALFAARYSAAGGLQWAQNVGAEGAYLINSDLVDRRSLGLVAHPNGAITVGTTYAGTAEVGAATKTSHTSVGNTNVVLFRINSADGLQCQ